MQKKTRRQVTEGEREKKEKIKKYEAKQQKNSKR
jgi:hypothetical protein